MPSRSPRGNALNQIVVTNQQVTYRGLLGCRRALPDLETGNRIQARKSSENLENVRVQSFCLRDEMRAEFVDQEAEHDTPIRYTCAMAKPLRVLPKGEWF